MSIDLLFTTEFIHQRWKINISVTKSVLKYAMRVLNYHLPAA